MANAQIQAFLKAAAKRREEQRKKEIEEQKELAHVPLTTPETSNTSSPETSSQQIVFNERQQMAITYAEEGRGFNLIGAAGTGKTTVSRECVRKLAEKFDIELESVNKDYKPIAVLAYTRRAARNSAKALKSIGADHVCMTAHSFLEFQPEEYVYFDEDGDEKTSMRFMPYRNKDNTIQECVLVIIEESSMMGLDLHQNIVDACPNATFVYIGDLNQLPPVFGDAILGYKLNELPVVELTQVYRQAMNSPIIAFQHNFTLAGKLPSETHLEMISKKCTDERGLNFKPFKMKVTSEDVYNMGVADYMKRMYEAGVYDPDQDTILIPFNKSFGSIGVNKYIADYFGKLRGAIVHEIIAGYEKFYYAEGDFVMYDKAECTITSIEPSETYSGDKPAEPSDKLGRDGLIEGKVAHSLGTDDNFVAMDFDALLNLGKNEDGEEIVPTASHIITVTDNETGQQRKIKSQTDYGKLDFGYCMTIHKSQGSEWRKVWLILHNKHASMLSREIIYTGMTRAKDRLEVIYTPSTGIGKMNSTVCRAIKRQRVPGLTWQKKAEYFKGKADS